MELPAYNTKTISELLGVPSKAIRAALDDVSAPSLGYPECPP